MTASQDGRDVVLSWTNPRLNIDGSAATDLAFVRITSDGGEVAMIAPAGAGSRQSYAIPAEGWIGTNRKFRVWLQTSRDKQSSVADVSITPVQVPGAVVGLKAVFDQYSIAVTWQPPAENENLAEGYFVRRLDRADPPVLTRELQYKDSTYDRGAQYSYEVVPARQVDSRWIRGPAAPPVLVAAVDKTPPRSPTGVQVVITDSGAIVIWDANQELDLAGYRVFRNEIRVSGDGVQTGNSFFDPAYLPGTTYSVSAVDESGNESSRSLIR